VAFIARFISYFADFKAFSVIWVLGKFDGKGAVASQIFAVEADFPERIYQTNLRIDTANAKHGSAGCLQQGRVVARRWEKAAGQGKNFGRESAYKAFALFYQAAVCG
jgi:hypothetical protein